ncbi:hypothetical protein BUALT_Bualt01G0141100 [Buddleja alternifolia]|uniref:Protein kinase domain-containing protein n=1 Tax=Buddleja alternifolia TaxID=168488 RepID=A0AAV6Y806_9LAMI|nr:hypothetical protein BUALT_Bualt01G0141100 [Buddleja alternifolia]
MMRNHTNTNASRNHIYNHHHELLPYSSFLIVLIPIIIVILLLGISLLTLMLRRLQFSKTNTTTSTADTKSIVHNANCMFIAHRAINIRSSNPDRGGCLYGSNVGGTSQPQPQVQIFTLKEVETATNKFSEATLIGKGVYKGVLKDGSLAAIKMYLRPNGIYAQRAFRLQVDLLSRLHSPYICELLGYCADENYRLLVFEYMSNGSLEKHLHCHNRRGKLKWGIRLKIALDCARALEYLHDHTNPSVIHRNLKCTNILLDNNFRAKLCGFGLAKIGSNKLNGLISTRVLGTTGYLAPDYGVILLELLTGRLPIDTTRPPGEHVLVSWALPRLTNRDKVMEMMDPGVEGQYSKKDLIQVAAIAAMCVQTEADYRPLITDVVQSLMPLVKNHSVLNPSTSPIMHV